MDFVQQVVDDAAMRNAAMRSAERNMAGVSVISRVAALLGAFGRNDRALGVSEIARRTGLPKSTVLRLVKELSAFGLLERVGSSVQLGLRLFELGQLVPRQRSLRDVATPYMADLREATGQTVHLAVLDGTEVVYVEILRSRNGPLLPSRVGGRLPAHATGVGKAILAHSSPECVDTLLGKPLPRLTRHTCAAPGLLRQGLETIRRTGVAFDREEAREGAVCAASPVMGPDGLVAGAISVSGWSSKMSLKRLAPAVRAVALTLSRAMQGRVAPPAVRPFGW